MDHLRRAKDEMDRDYAQPLDVATLARTALCSEAHYIRSFKKQYGETPHAYLQRRRTVTEIALDVGFTSISWFTTAFKDVMDETPTAYRDRLRGAPPAMVPGCFTMMWTRRAVFRKPDDGPDRTVGE